MEAALTWLFGSGHRVPDGRTSSFTHPLLPLVPTRPSSAPRPPRGVRACPLPTNRPTFRSRPATVGYNVDTWADHYATYFTNSRGQRIFVQVWRPHSHVKNDAARGLLQSTSSSSSSSMSDGLHPESNSFIHNMLHWIRRRWDNVDPSHSHQQQFGIAPIAFPSSPAARARRVKMQHDKEKAIVYIIHGLNDHSNKYARVARAWVDAGYVVVAHDFHGHGRSDGFRAYTSSMDHYVRDAYDAIRHTDNSILPARLSKLPKFLLAHSLGGAVAIHLARDYQDNVKFNGAMLTAPAVRVFPKPLLKLFAPVIATLAPLLPVQRLKFDRSQKRNRRSPRRRKRDSGNTNAQEDEDDEYCPYEDPLVVRSPVRARVGYEVLKSCDRIMSEADRFKLPVFVAHSAHDRVTNAKGTVEFHSRIASDDKTVKLYDGSVHDLLAEKREVVMADMVQWASHRLR